MNYNYKLNRFAIISPATEVRPIWVDGAVAELRRRGISVRVMPHAIGPRCGSYAASDADRLADLREALMDPDTDVILCSRGGYGCVHLLSDELESLVRENPKWMVGFSDVSALHALWQRAGVPSLHCSMAKQLTLFDIQAQDASIRSSAEALKEIPDAADMERLRECVRVMFSILEGHREEIRYEAPSPEGVIPGHAEGTVVGGNLAVLNGLAATPWDMLSAKNLHGKILFLEDVGEKIYQVERMLKRLQLAGVFDAVAGIVFGKFTEYSPDRNFSSMESMIATRLRQWGVSIPVALSFPIGHVSCNFPIPEGAAARLDVSAEKARLMIKTPSHKKC